MIGQLESMARLQGFDLVSYLLSMARVEAQTSARALQAKKLPAGVRPEALSARSACAAAARPVS